MGTARACHICATRIVAEIVAVGTSHCRAPAEPRNAAIALLMSVLHKLLVYCPGFRARMRVKIGSAMAALLLRQ